MAKYIVTLFEPPGSEEAKEMAQAIESKYEGYHPCDNQGLSFLLATTDSLDMVARNLGLTGQEGDYRGAAGLIIALNTAYIGRGPDNLADWLAEDK